MKKLEVKIKKVLENHKIKYVYSGTDFHYFEIPFAGSPEGLNIDVRNTNEWMAYCREKTLVELGLIKSQEYIEINPWVYLSSMTQKEIFRMKKIIKILLNAFPKAVLFFEDDASMDYNPNSIMPEHEMNYTIKASTSNEWINKFDEMI